MSVVTPCPDCGGPTWNDGACWNPACESYAPPDEPGEDT
jgi:hypothetical protein